MEGERDDPAVEHELEEDEAERQEQVLEREGFEEELMQEGRSEAGEDVGHVERERRPA